MGMRKAVSIPYFEACAPISQGKISTEAPLASEKRDIATLASCLLVSTSCTMMNWPVPETPIENIKIDNAIRIREAPFKELRKKVKIPAHVKTRQQIRSFSSSTFLDS